MLSEFCVHIVDLKALRPKCPGSLTGNLDHFSEVTVGTFNGFIAIFTRGYEGKRMTAKVASKWLSQDPIESYKNFDYSRTTRNTGAGYLINVDVYINGVLKESTQVLTR